MTPSWRRRARCRVRVGGEQRARSGSRSARRRPAMLKAGRCRAASRVCSARLKKYLAEGFPEPERAISDRDLRRRCQAATLQIEQQITPRLGALAHAICEADEFLLAFRRRAN